jgi:hypothetical protein
MFVNRVNSDGTVDVRVVLSVPVVAMKIPDHNALRQDGQSAYTRFGLWPQNPGLIGRKRPVEFKKF